MPLAVFGTAHLFGLVGDRDSHALLRDALSAGYTAFDTAPSYGHGRSEPELAALLAPAGARVQVTSKVGLAPSAPRGRAVRVAKSAARRLPSAVQTRLRGADTPPRGRFDLDFVRESVRRTLQRFPRLDRLMLHEPWAADLRLELVDYLRGLRDDGAVHAIGVATRNAETPAVLAAAPELFDAVHLEVGPDATAVVLPAGIATVIGHGALGPGGAGLARVRAMFDADPELSGAWREATRGTRWDSPAGVPAALIARAAQTTIRCGSGTAERVPLAGLIVATSRTERLTQLRELAAGEVTLPVEVDDVLTRAIGTR